MIVQCRICKRIRDNGHYRLPWPGELGHDISETYCPRCAHETLTRIQNGEFARLAVFHERNKLKRQAVNA